MRNAAAIPPLLMHESNIRPKLFDNKHAIIKDAAQANKNWLVFFFKFRNHDFLFSVKSSLKAFAFQDRNFPGFMD